MKHWILLTSIALAGCATQSGQTCTAENITTGIESMNKDIDAEIARHEQSSEATVGDEKADHLLAGAKLSEAKMVLLYARFQAKDGNIEEACEVMNRVRTDSALGIQFSPL